MTDDPLRAVVRLRTIGPSGLNPPQTEFVERLQTFSEAGLIDELNADVWDGSMGITQPDNRDPEETYERIARFNQWADDHGYTLRPAFEWRSTESAGTQEREIIPPLITLAIYEGQNLQAVYPHHTGEDVQTVHDGVNAVVSIASDAKGSGNTQSETRAVAHSG